MFSRFCFILAQIHRHNKRLSGATWIWYNERETRIIPSRIPVSALAAESRAHPPEAPCRRSGKTFSYAVTAGGHLAGSVSIFRCGNIHFRTAEIGYYIGENFWGHGIATHAVKQACGDIFARTDILRIFAEPFSYNAASCRVLEKAGFQFEGLLRNNAVKTERFWI